MAETKGFFSIIQFCPDLDREETANVGVVLIVPGLRYFDVRFSEDNEAPKQRFGVGTIDDTRLAVAKRAIEGRLRHELTDCSGSEDLVAFAKKEGNHLRLTAPRIALVKDAAGELDELYRRLVHLEVSSDRS